MVPSLALLMDLGSTWFHVRFWSAYRAVFGVLPPLDIKVITICYDRCGAILDRIQFYTTFWLFAVEFVWFNPLFDVVLHLMLDLLSV